MNTLLQQKSNTYQPDRLIRESERRLLTSISRSQAYKLEQRGLFPKRITLGARSCAWRLSEIQQWIKGEYYA